MRIRRTLKEMWQLCLITGVTTAVGFGTFYFSELIPLSDFGMDAFIAILPAYPTMLFLTIAFLFFVAPQAKQEHSYAAIEGFFSHCTHWLQKYSLWFVILIMIISAPIIYQLRYMYTETNFLDAFFLPNSEIYQALDFIDKELGGSGAIDISLSDYTSGRGWQPIAHDTNTRNNDCDGARFTGTFEGSGFQISRLFIDCPTEYCIELFGQATGEICA